jgi:hypothetical protein
MIVEKRSQIVSAITGWTERIVADTAPTNDQ